MSSEDLETTSSVCEPEPKVHVDYCPSCSLPYEYCEYSQNFEGCARNLETVDAELLKQLRELRLQHTKTEAKSDAKTDGGDGDAKAEGKEGEEDDDEDEDDDDEDEAAAASASSASKASTGVKEIIIQVKERTRHKSITIVKNIERFGLKAKDVAKLFSKKFATSASCTDEGIQMNGDIARDVASYLIDQYPDVFEEDNFFSTNKAGKKCHLF